MPLKRTTKNGRPAFKYGDSGKAYSYKPGDKTTRELAKKKALRQGRAMKAGGS